MKQISIKYGLMGGLAVCTFMTILYFLSKQMMVGSGFSTLGIWLIYSVFIYLSGMALLENPDQIDKLLKTLFLTFLIASAIYIVYDFIFYNFIDKGLETIQKQAMMDYLNGTGSIQEQTARNEEIKLAHLHTLKGGLWNYFYKTIFGFIISFLVAYVLKQE
jgi:putative flippase GtrA